VRGIIRPVSMLLACVVAPLACGRTPPALPPPGTEFELVLVVETRRDLTPELERVLAPLSDTGVAILTVQRVVADSAFGTYTGPSKHFWPPFRDLGSEFRITRSGRRWEIVLGPQAVDAGMRLEGVESSGEVRGRWIARTALPDSGHFRIRPAT
jgi:hypothetical protein